MSGLTSVDAVFGDLLTECNLKPWWEKIRGYFFALSVAASLSIAYVLQEAITVTCMPETTNATVLDDFTTPQAGYINSVCTKQMGWHIRFAGLLILTSCALMLFASSYWLYIPSVVNSFRTFVEVDTIIGKLHLAKEELKNAFMDDVVKREPTIQQQPNEPVNVKDKKVKENVQKIRTLLWSYESERNVRGCYFARNLFAILVATLEIGCAAAITTLLAVDNGEFRCVLKVDNPLVTITRKYSCFHNTFEKVIPYLVTFTVSVIFQLAFLAVGIDKTREETVQPEKYTTRGIEILDYIEFMTSFWKNSRPAESGVIAEFCLFTVTEGLDRILDRIDQGDIRDVQLLATTLSMRTNDHNLPSFLTKLSKAPDVLEYMAFMSPPEILHIDGNELGAEARQCWERLCSGSKRHKEIIWLVSRVEMQEWNTDMANALGFLYKYKFWEIFVQVLDLDSSGSKTTQEGRERQKEFFEELFQKIKPDLNAIGKPYYLGRSLLYYVRTPGAAPKLNAARRLLKYAAKDGRVKYIHDGGRSFLPKKWLSESRRGDLYRTKFEKIIKLCQTTNDELASINQDVIEPVKQGSDNIFYYKFNHWDDNAQELARYFYQGEHWQCFVDLLNAYIIINENNEELRILPCRIRQFQVLADPPANRRLHPLLECAFGRPVYYPKYIFTAAKHMLGCIRRGKARFEDDELGALKDHLGRTEMNPRKDMLQIYYQGLESLKKIIEKCEQIQPIPERVIPLNEDMRLIDENPV